MPSSRRTLIADDLYALTQAQRAAGQPHAICAALEALSAQVIGHRLFTVMRFDSALSEVQRIYSNMPAAYPPGGRKQKKATAWADHVLRDMKAFLGSGPDDIRSAFDDHETILGLGLGSVLNIPVVYAGHCVGTMNLLHEAGWYRADDEQTGALLAAFLIAPLLDPAA
ncbi:MAG TPA: GAF domain-containing protein [Pseudolabrys sp.]|nr:GAF domain-containing protein [Pseudolabrys sp.]